MYRKTWHIQRESEAHVDECETEIAIETETESSNSSKKQAEVAAAAETSARYTSEYYEQQQET